MSYRITNDGLVIKTVVQEKALQDRIEQLRRQVEVEACEHRQAERAVKFRKKRLRRRLKRECRK